MTMAGPWASRPDIRPWCARLLEPAARWRPDPALCIDVGPVIGALEVAAAAAEPWLAHPCLNRLTSLGVQAGSARDVGLVTWIAAHVEEPIGAITLDRPMWRWSVAGQAVIVPPGRHDLARVAAGDREGAGERAIAPDPCCRSIGYALPDSWPEAPGRADAARLEMAVRDITRAYARLRQALPACWDWAAAVTRVVVPIRPDDGTWSSGSQAEIPGLIHVAGLNGPVAALEGLVHESAHHHFTMSEASAALVDPLHDRLYPSPVRVDPRPLRGVFMAVHALGHIAAFYDNGIASGLLHPRWADRRRRLAAATEQGLGVLRRARAHLTTHGEALLAAAPVTL